MSFSIFLMDGNEVNVNKLDGKRKINFGHVDKILKVS